MCDIHIPTLNNSRCGSRIFVGGRDNHLGGGANIYNIFKISPKLHEIKKNLGREGPNIFDVDCDVYI